MNRKLTRYGLSIAVAAALLFGCLNGPVSGYVEESYALGRIVNESTNVVYVVVESVDKVKNTIIYKKVRDLKGTHPGETIKHLIAQAGFAPREWQNVMAWAEPGKTAVFFHNGGAGECCIDNYWYQTPNAGEWWNMSHAEPFMMRSYCGKPEKLAAAVTAMMAGQEVVVPCMVDGDKNALHMRTARIQRIKASLKLITYDVKRDFVDFGSGGDELRAVAGMPGFTHTLTLNRIGAGATGIASADMNNDGRADLCVFGERQLSLLQNAGNAFDEVRLPILGGARAVAWADYDGDKKVDVFVATPTGPRLFRNMTEKAVLFEDVSAGLPKQNYWNITAAAWLDYDGDGKPDLLVADGLRGLRLYRNLGKQSAPPVKSTVGKWYYAGPFDNTGQQGFDKVYPPELGVDLAAQYTGKNNEKFGWKEGAFNDAQVNNLAIFPKPEMNNDVATYIYREFTVGSAIECPFSFGSDDTLTVWMNGQKVISENVYRGCAPDQNLATLKLQAGKNKLLIKVCQGNGGFEFYCAPKVPEVTAPVPLLFEDVSDKVGLGENGIGANLKGDRLIIADVNGDGRPDFLFTGGNGVLALNMPNGFVESKDSGISFKTGGVTPAFADFNGDGKADLFIPQMGVCKLLRNDGSGRFSDVTSQSGDLAKAMGDARGAAWAEFKKGRHDLLVGCWRGPNRYFRNDGNGRFTDRTEQIGLDGKMFNTTAISVQDLNKDGVPDVVFNNEGQDPVLYITNPEFFVDPAAQLAQTPLTPTAVGGAGASGSVSFFSIFAVGGVVFLLFLALRRGASRTSIIVLALLTAAGGSSTRAGDAPAPAADWPMARGNAQRTGNVDGLPGPKGPSPNILWVHKSMEHFIAAPVPCKCGKLYMPVMGALNTGSFHAMSLAPGAADRVMWSKSVPFVARPVVCSPAVAEGMLVFGDGMHQTDDAELYCLNPETGVPFWRYAVTGKLVHLEAAPIIDKGRVFACGGNAGVICLDAKRVILDGKEQDVAETAPILAKKWAEMTAKYEADKKVDPLLAIPPSEDALPKPTPKLIWQQGKDKWHVDAPPVVTGDFVIVSSAYLDDEKEGKRALICMKKSDGSIVWEVPLTLNPWAGATVAGQSVLVACSSIRFDRKTLNGATGEIVAVNLATGAVIWKKPVPNGAVLSPIAVKGDVFIYTTTAKEVIARNIQTIARVWQNPFTGPNPFFGGVAIAGDLVYATDLYGSVFCMNFADGAVQWQFDLAQDLTVSSKSMVFSSPTVHGGDLYVGSCNPDGETQQSTYVVCLSDKPSAMPVKWVPVTVDAAKRSVSIPCRVAPRKLASLKDVYPLEVVATYPSPRGQKAHETVVIFNSKPSDVHKALESIGLKPGKPAVGEGVVGSGAEVKVLLEVPGVTGTPRLIPLEKLMVDTRTGRALPMLTWHFTGSVMRQPDPTKDEKVYAADMSGTLISLLPVTDETVCQLHLTLADGKPLRLETNKDLIPPEGTELNLIIQAK